MQLPQQPQFKIRIYDRGSSPTGDENFRTRGSRNMSSKGSTKYVDVEYATAYPVVYEENGSLLNTLSFTIDKFADMLLPKVFLGQWVSLFGGYYTEDFSGIKKIFSGTITRIRTEFPDNGAMKFSVEAMTYAFNQMGKNTYQMYIYPDKNSTRKFAKGKDTLSLKDLVEGLIKESGMKVGTIKLPSSVASKKFTKKEFIYQRSKSDWTFLLQLGQQYGCSVWTELKNGTEVINFVELTKAVKEVDKSIAFFYPLYGDKGVKEIQDNEWIKLGDKKWHRPRMLRSVTVDEDISLSTAVVRSGMYIDKETGEQKEALFETKEVDGRRVTEAYVFDEARVEFVRRYYPEIAEQITAGGPTSLEWSNGATDPKDETPKFARYYYKSVKLIDEQVAVFDQAFFGITISATCNMDLDITSQRSYEVRGILRYGGKGSQGRYFLRGLKHIWDADGNSTELDLIA